MVIKGCLHLHSVCNIWKVVIANQSASKCIAVVMKLTKELHLQIIRTKGILTGTVSDTAPSPTPVIHLPISNIDSSPAKPMSNQPRTNGIGIPIRVPFLPKASINTSPVRRPPKIAPTLTRDCPNKQIIGWISSLYVWLNQALSVTRYRQDWVFCQVSLP